VKQGDGRARGYLMVLTNRRSHGESTAVDAELAAPVGADCEPVHSALWEQIPAVGRADLQSVVQIPSSTLMPDVARLMQWRQLRGV
jgi:hypothetical protein